MKKTNSSWLLKSEVFSLYAIGLSLGRICPFPMPSTSNVNEKSMHV